MDEEKQQRRADNQIWNGAGAYGYTNRFRSYDRDGQASLYMNTVMGLARRFYDYGKIETFLNQLETYPNCEVYTEVFWLVTERMMWLRDREDRPVLDRMRRVYAEQMLADSGGTNALDVLKAGWFRRALGLAREESDWTAEVLDALEFDPELSEEDLIARMQQMLTRYFRRIFRDKLDFLNSNRVDLGFFSGLGRNRRGALRMLGSSGRTTGGRAYQSPFFGWGKPKARRVREYAEGCFGTSMLPETDRIALEQKLCTGAHRGCFLYYTKGEPPKEIPAICQGERERFARQAEKNRAYYEKDLIRNRIAVQKLTQRLRNTLLLQEESEGSRFRSGQLVGNLAWRAAAFEDCRIFRRNRKEEPEELVVDVVLDASASQNGKQEQLAAQSYILAEALTRCRIPVRVMSYCSVSGCTVIRVFRDYTEERNNEKIFEFASCGWNRDGLALRGVDWLLNRDTEGHRLVIVLSDANPNDDQKLIPEGKFSIPRDYSGPLAVADAAREASELRRGNRTLLCIFSGMDDQMDNCRKIYGRDFIRLPSMGWFAETVGTVIQKKLQILTQ